MTADAGKTRVHSRILRIGLPCAFFVVVRLDANCRESCLQQLWDQCRPDARILDQNSVCPGTSHQMFDLFADFQNGFGRRAGEIGIRLQIRHRQQNKC
jgi:hypothetical protein